MINVAKTLRAADEKALAAERRLQDEKHRLMRGDVSAEVSRLYVVLPSAISHAASAQKHPLSLHVCNFMFCHRCAARLRTGTKSSRLSRASTKNFAWCMMK